jgi:Spy/CpxP family protein refolding chaperone
MTTFTGGVKQMAVLLATLTVALASVSAQAPPPAQKGSQQRQDGRAGGRAPGAPGGELNLQTVQSLVDGWALVEAQKQLDLSEEQHGTFVPRMMRLQNLRRRHMMERQRLLREMGAVAFSSGSQRPDEAALTEKLKAFDELSQRSAQEVRQATQELDAILTPYQRVRFRVFEERIERQKIDMLTRARAGRAGGGTAPAEPPAKGRGGK